MATEENMIPIEPYLKDFKQYLDANSRCILSAKFGDGKSYFISRFMKVYSKDYLFIPIYPVNYQVMDNKDIFELIKRDILIKLLSSEEININEIELNTASLFYSFFMSNPSDSILDILGLIPDINICGVDINISNVIEKLGEIKDKFDKYKQEFASVDKTSEEYITKFDSLKGSIYEFDTISQLICDIIREYKKQHPSKQVVLIIEDLDRIDPGHIFRILNIFSAHFDRYTTGLTEFEKTCGDNKFCLDKIITVCDIDNIRNIYSHVYGENTDFIGYISKFSNNQHFDYSLQEKIKDYIINNLFDKRIQKHAVLCDRLAALIIMYPDGLSKQKYNLRLIKERIKKAESQIRNYKIPLTKGLNGLSLYSKSDYTYFLALLKAFKIDFSKFIVTNDEEFRECMACLVGPFWALAEETNKNLSFNLSKDNIICVHTFRNGYHSEDVSTAFEYTLENKIIKDIQIRFNDYHQIGIKVYDTIGSVTNYLFKNAII
ncbi:hypothetical protein [Bacteroides thetaiotaomicron]|uniref:hypothetical protein n=1 Tax=Bacteroides thetaiotaomicron TaxID=818 RepID=UPI0032C19C2B